MNILIIGSGGREHALAWKIKQSPKTEKLFISPGNAGTASIAENISLDVLNHAVVSAWCKENNIDLVVIGPDDQLALGMTDSLMAEGIKVFGPTKEAAKLEWSKAYAKEFMIRHNIPTAAYKVCTSSSEALSYMKTQSFPQVIKADGLALGKGVVIVNTIEEAEATLKDIMDNKVHGEAGTIVVIEEYLTGKEISIHAFCDGITAKLFPAAQDHKRAYDNDKGPNTGGMGTIAPVPWVTATMLEEIKHQVVQPALDALRNEGNPFKGLLFPGIMITDSGPKVIEFNARFGDPETQSYMRLLETDLVDIMMSCVEGKLNEQQITWSDESACCIVLASGGYPGAYAKGKEIIGLENIIDSTVVFHAGTTLKEGTLITNGGRVLGVTATGENLKQALDNAYREVEKIDFEGKQFRTDIGKKSL